MLDNAGIDSRLTAQIRHTGNSCCEPSCQLAFKDTACCAARIRCIQRFGFVEVSSHASLHCFWRAILQVCRISDACLHTAGVVVKTANAPAKYMGRRTLLLRTGESTQFGPDALSSFQPLL